MVRGTTMNMSGMFEGLLTNARLKTFLRCRRDCKIMNGMMNCGLNSNSNVMRSMGQGNNPD